MNLITRITICIILIYMCLINIISAETKTQTDNVSKKLTTLDKLLQNVKNGDILKKEEIKSIYNVDVFKYFNLDREYGTELKKVFLKKPLNIKIK